MVIGDFLRYRYPDGNEVVFVMFIFNVKADIEGKVLEDNTLIYYDENHESLRLEFKPLEDLKNDIKTILRN
ncbi:hypothetical protein D3C76_566410 [compost metagenome]